MEGKMRRTCCT